MEKLTTVKEDSPRLKFYNICYSPTVVKGYTFPFQKMPFYPGLCRPAGKAAQGPIGPDNPVTRHDDRQGVSGKRRSHSPRGLGRRNASCHLAVGADFSPRDIAGLRPDPAVKIAPAIKLKVMGREFYILPLVVFF